MFALALTLCLSTTPASAPSARLLPDSQLSGDVQNMSLSELQLERARLVELMPTKFLPVAVTVGVPLLAFFAAGTLPSVFPALAVGAAQVAFIVVAAVIGVAGLVVGLVRTLSVAQRQAALRADIADVDARIAGLTPKPLPIAPPPVERPYEPVPGVLAPTVVPRLLIARF
ncbi:MAG: hypothetical protein ACO1OB_01890 [Archangium sp.]